MSQNTYTYSVQKLKDIATNYDHIYQGIEFRKGKPYHFPKVYYHFNYYYIGGGGDDDDLHYLEVNPWKIAEYKADFDMALNSIGRARWTGELESGRFSDYKRFGRLQRIVIADILNGDNLKISDWELEEMGFYNIPRARGLAYRWMANFLNGIPFRGSQTRFVSKPLDKAVDN